MPLPPPGVPAKKVFSQLGRRLDQMSILGTQGVAPPSLGLPYIGDLPDGRVYSSIGACLGRVSQYQVQRSISDASVRIDMSMEPLQYYTGQPTTTPGGTVHPKTAEIKEELQRALKAEKAERKRLKREKRAKRRRDELHVTALAALEEIATDHLADAGARVAAAHQILKRVA